MTNSISDRQIAALQGIADGLQEVAAAIRQTERPGPCRCSTVPVFDPLSPLDPLVRRTDCPCAACDPGLILDGKPTGLPSRMSVCPDCGNKRCPKAANHAKWECSGSNEVGQVGVPAEGTQIATQEPAEAQVERVLALAQKFHADGAIIAARMVREAVAGRASGGPVTPHPYIVGEQGPVQAVVVDSQAVPSENEEDGRG
jgi:hypothetical protein